MKAIGSAALIVPVLLACASTSEPAEHEGRIVLTGRITVTGSAPHVKLVIVTDDQAYELVGETSEGLWRLQQRRVTVSGHVVRQALGPGFPAQLEVEQYADVPSGSSS